MALLFCAVRIDNARWGRVLLIIGCIFRIDNAQWAVPCSLQNVWRSDTVIPASLCLLFLPHLHANPTGTTGPARILCISPRLPPYQLTPTSVDQNAEACPTSPPFVLAVAHSSTSVILARIHIESSYFLTDKQSSACLVKRISHSDAPVLSSHWISLSHRHF